jgi:hypothetical protein
MMLSPRDRRYLLILLPIGIVAAVLADGAVLALVGFGGFPATGIGPTGPPFYSTGINLGAANDTQLPDSVAFPVIYAEPGWTVGNISLGVTDTSGSPVTTGIAATLSNGTVRLATYNFTENRWTVGGGLVVSVGEQLVLDSPGPLPVLGGTLELTQGGGTAYYSVP